MNALDWSRDDKALELLAELDACERSSDHWYGKGDIAKAFSERCEEIELALNDLRSDCVNAFADATGHAQQSDEWLDAWAEADSEAESVEDACQRSRLLHLGDTLIERAAAA